MNDYKIGLTTGILLTISSFLFISVALFNNNNTKLDTLHDDFYKSNNTIDDLITKTDESNLSLANINSN